MLNALDAPRLNAGTQPTYERTPSIDQRPTQGRRRPLEIALDIPFRWSRFSTSWALIPSCTLCDVPRPVLQSKDVGEYKTESTAGRDLCHNEVVLPAFRGLVCWFRYSEFGICFIPSCPEASNILSSGRRNQLPAHTAWHSSWRIHDHRTHPRFSSRVI